MQALRYWLNLRDQAPTVTALLVIADNMGIRELKLDVERLGAEIECGKVSILPALIRLIWRSRPLVESQGLCEFKRHLARSVLAHVCRHSL